MFAQKDDANTAFQIQLQPKSNTTNSTSSFLVSLYDGQYESTNSSSNSTNSTCFDTCGEGLGVEFVTLNGTTYYNRFQCWADKLILSLIFIILALTYS